MSYIRARAKDLGIPENFYQKIDVHVHCAEVQCPGWFHSAGLAITTAIVSALTKIPVNRKLL